MKLKQILFTLIFLGFILVIITIDRRAIGQTVASLETIDRNLPGDLTLYQFFQNSNPLEGLLVSIPMQQSNDNHLFFSVYLDINADSKFQQNELVVDEMPALIEEEFPNVFPVLANSRHTLNLLNNLTDGVSLNSRIVLSDNSGEYISFERPVQKTYQEIGEIFNPDPGLVGGIGRIFPGSFSVSKSYAQTAKKDPAKVPVNHKGVPDLEARTGKPNECVPLSFANSLLWLAKTHGFESKMPGTDNALIDELATDMKWTRGGTKHDDILPGKEAFTRRRSLELNNKKIDNEVINGESQLWKKIVSELNDGEDVELILDFKQSPKGTADKSHAVTVTGADKTKKGKQTLTFHDPATPKGSETYEMDRNGQIVGYPFGKVYGNFIISESFNGPTPTLTVTPSKTPTPTPIIPTGSPSPS